jgi:peptidoglycan/xylan/chitin deacetylase (PgdA/CDA1 family)
MMRAFLSRGALAATHGLNTAWRYVRRDGRRLAVLMYHGVVEEALDPFCWHQLPLANFREQMQFVARTCTVLPLEEALERMEAGTLPHRACAITFDDGFRNNATTAYPVLRELGLPATIFLVTGLVTGLTGTGAVLWPDRLYLAVKATDASTLDASRLGLGQVPLGTSEQKAVALDDMLRVLKERPAEKKNADLACLLKDLGAVGEPEAGAFGLLSWEEVAGLAQDKRITFGAHTTRHEILSRQPDEAVEQEIRSSHEEVRRRLDAAPQVFAYPNGRRIDFDQRAQDVLRGLAVPWALSTREAVARSGGDPLDVPRICVGADMPLTRFRQLVGGTVDLLKGRGG